MATFPDAGPSSTSSGNGPGLVPSVWDRLVGCLAIRVADHRSTLLDVVAAADLAARSPLSTKPRESVDIVGDVVEFAPLIVGTIPATRNSVVMTENTQHGRDTPRRMPPTSHRHRPQAHRSGCLGSRTPASRTTAWRRGRARRRG